MDTVIGRFFLCLLIHPTMMLLEFIIRIIDGDLLTGGLLSIKMNTELGITILISAWLIGALFIVGVMGAAIWKKSRLAAIIIAPLIGLASAPYSMWMWVIYACSTTGECF